MNRHVPSFDEDQSEAASFGTRAQPDFARAQRHSARVRWIRRLLPVSIIGAVVVMAVLGILSKLKLSIDLPFDIGHLTLSGSRLTMEQPKLSGFTDDNRGYRVTARTASQDLNRPDIIELADVEARLEMADNGWASVMARTGSFDTKRQLISLGNGVDLAMKGGYGGHLKDADVDVKAGTISTEHPVEFTYLDGKLVADTLVVSDRGAKALFQGNVQLDFRLTNLPGTKTQGTQAPSGQQQGHQGQPVAGANGAIPAPTSTGTTTPRPPATQAAADAPPPRRPAGP